MFMVIMTVCSVKFGMLGGCQTLPIAFHHGRNVDECLVIMLKAAITLHIAKPDWQVTNVTCVPVEET